MLVRALRNQPVQQLQLDGGRGWREGIARTRRLIHRQLERVSCSGVTTQRRSCFGGGCIAENVEVGSVGLEWLAP